MNPEDGFPGPKEDFAQGFSEATGLPLVDAYRHWLKYAATQGNEDWKEHEERGGYEIGLEHGADYMLQVGGQRPTASEMMAFPSGRWL